MRKCKILKGLCMIIGLIFLMSSLTFASGGASENEAETLSINNETHELRLYHPEGVTVDSSGNIYIVDTRNHCIQKLNSDSTWVFSFRIYGNKDGEFTYPKKLH